jgi:hypothetical protein
MRQYQGGTCKHSQYMGRCRGCWCTHSVVARLAGVQTEPQQHETMCAKHRSSGLEVGTPHSKMHCCTLHTLTRVHTHNSGAAGRESNPPPCRSLPDTSPAAWGLGPTRCCPPAHSLSKTSQRRTSYTAAAAAAAWGADAGPAGTLHISLSQSKTHARALTHTHKQQLLEAHSLVLRTLYKRKPLLWQPATAPTPVPKPAHEQCAPRSKGG